jgi:hypothetical protein
MNTTANTLAAIAQEHLGLETLETRNSDRLDFSDQAVWMIERALLAAFEAGKASTGDADAALREMVAAFGTGSYGTKRQAAALKRARKTTGQEG